MNRPTRLRIRESGPAAIIDLEGDLTYDSEQPLLAALRDPSVSARAVVLLNFAAVGYINSAGISLLVSLISEILPSERALIVCCLSSHYQKIFRMVGLTAFLQGFETETAALAWAESRRRSEF